MAKGKYTKENFEAYDKDNPHIWAMFEKFALIAAARRSHYSAKMVMYRVRWDTDISDSNPNAEFKLSDGWISHYARKFIRVHPEHSEFFKTVQRRHTYHEDNPPPPVITEQSPLL